MLREVGRLKEVLPNNSEMITNELKPYYTWVVEKAGGYSIAQAKNYVVAYEFNFGLLIYFGAKSLGIQTDI